MFDRVFISFFLAKHTKGFFKEQFWFSQFLSSNKPFFLKQKFYCSFSVSRNRFFVLSNRKNASICCCSIAVFENIFFGKTYKTFSKSTILSPKRKKLLYFFHRKFQTANHSSMLASISNFLLALREFIFPNICFFCKKNLDGNQLRMCPECWNELTPITKDDPTYLHKKSEIRYGDVIDDFLACFLFEKDKRIQDVMHGLKYEQKTSFGATLGKHLGKKMLTENIFTSADYLIPIPLHSLKLR